MSKPSAAAPEVLIRPAAAKEHAAIGRLVTGIGREVYGHLFEGEPPRPVGKWVRALVAEADGRLVGVMVADDDWIEDLWVTADQRGRGIGGRLLAAGEQQIAARGCTLAYLRVIAENHAARRFYARHGWAEVESYPHERWGFEMIDMSKRVAGAG